MPSLVPDSLKVKRDLEDLENRLFDHRSMLKEASEAKKKRVDNVNAFIVVVCDEQISFWTIILYACCRGHSLLVYRHRV